MCKIFFYQIEPLKPVCNQHDLYKIDMNMIAGLHSLLIGSVCISQHVTDLPQAMPLTVSRKAVPCVIMSV